MKYRFQHIDSQKVGKNQIVLFGRTLEGKSIAVRIFGFKPSLCVRTGDKTIIHRLNVGVGEARCSRNNHFAGSQRQQKDANHKQGITGKMIHGQDICDFDESGPARFVQIFAKDTSQLYLIKDILTTGSYEMYDKIDEKIKQQYLFPDKRTFTLYNDQVDYPLQYLIHKNIYSCSWMEIEGDKADNKITSCDIEIKGDQRTHRQIECNDVAPWKILCYDIESVPHPRGNGKFNFPEASEDPVCTIGATLQCRDTIEKYVWILNPEASQTSIETLPALETPTDEYTTEDIVVYHFDDELTMLKSFNSFIVEQDIDILEGYNTAWFDHPYLFNRYHKLIDFKPNRNSRPWDPQGYPTWGRLLNTESKIKETVFQSNQAGKNVTKRLYIPGRIDHDGYQVMKKNHNLSSYKLDEVAKQFLGTAKYPMDYNEIHPKFHTREGRIELAQYCVKDAWLTRRIMDKLNKLFVSFQLSCVTGISLNDVLNRGQGIRTISLMLRYCKKRDPPYFIPRREKTQKYRRINQLNVEKNQLCGSKVIREEISQGFKGAVVLEPKPKFYKEAIATLDFASLYPSIMICLNMSYETIISREKMLRMDWKEDKDVRTVPDYSWKDGRMQTNINYDDNVIFATKETRQGILPEILESLWDERKRVKKEMKQFHPDTVQYKIANGRQLGLKVCMNSIYGFTGATVGMLPDKRIAESVTKYGRGLTLKTQDLIENHPVWGKEHGVRCIYGDTDSVFCHLPRSLCDGPTPEATVKRAEEIGIEMGEYVDSHFLRPVELEFEKVYLPFMLLKKKRYCGKKFEEGHVKIDMKGVECVRRDFCPLLVKTQKEMLTVLMNTMDIEKACNVVSKAMQDLAMNKIPLELLTMSKKLSRSPEEYKAKAAHVNLAMRINKERGEQHGFVAGDRVPYVIACGTSHKMSDNAVLPEEITSGKFVVDREYYREKQMIPPMTRILEKLCDNPKTLFLCKQICNPQTTGIFKSWVTKRKKVESDVEHKSVKKKKKQVTLFTFF